VTFVVALATAAGMVLGFRGSLRRSLAVLLAFTFLVPAGLPVGHLTGLSYFPASRLVLVAVAAKLVVAWLRRELPAGLFDLTPVHATFALFLGVALVLGVATAAPGTDTTEASHLWVTLASMLGFFVVVLALVRAIADDGWVLRVVAVVFAVAAGIALVEYVTGSSWNSFLYGGHPTGTVEAEPLSQRLGRTRVRGPSAFSLAFAWLLVGALLAAIATGMRAIGRTGRGVALVVVGLLGLAGYFTYSRSVVVPVAVILVAIPFLTRRRRLFVVTGAAVIVVAAAYALTPALGHHFSPSADQGSIDVRFQRMPLLFAQLASHAYTGLGLGGLTAIGLPSTDATYLLIYGSLGMIGVAVLATLQITALVVSGRALLTADQGRRDIAAACFLGVVALTGAGFAFDAVSVVQVQDLLWLFVAVAIAASERDRGPIRWLARPSVPRLIALGAATAAGFVAAAGAPTTIAGTVVFGTAPAKAALTADTSYVGFVTVNSICDLVKAEKHLDTATTVRCDHFLRTPGQGQLRIEAPDVTRAKGALSGVTAAIYSYPQLRGFRLADEPRFEKAKPTALRTAPVWMPLLIGIGLVLLPEERRPSRRRVARSRERSGSRPGPSG